LSSERKPHIWWCPTGPLAFLPIHAAGLYGPSELPGPQLSDFAISSYTPTLTALLNHNNDTMENNCRLLIIAQPTAFRRAPLPGTTEELEKISKHNTSFAISQLVEDEVTVDCVARGMEDASWAHFACHGVQNYSNPLESALLLGQDIQLTLSEITKLSLPHAQLAFLSACQTAAGDEGLAEEAVHLAAGMLLAGYRGVIAIMWSIGDHDAPLVADIVYSHLSLSKKPNATQAAHALHAAVQELCCKKPKEYLSWVPYIHFGV
jgi:CHAT domain-containing protein